MVGATALLWLGVPSVRAEGFGPYLRVDGGVNIVADNDIHIDGASGTLSLDTGYRADGAVGYEFGRWVALEIEGGYAESSVNKLTRESSVANLQGHSSLTQVPLLFNAVVRYENESDWLPYLGVGAGGVMTTLKISGDDDSQAVFAWQAKAGVIYKIEEEAWLDLGYKLLVTSEADYSLGGGSLNAKEIFNHFFGVSVIWRF